MRHRRALVLVLLVSTLAVLGPDPAAQRASNMAQTERVPAAGVVSGVPQGMFVGRSLLTGRAVCLLFLSGGRVTRAIPVGGLDPFDWARHATEHRGDAGQWQVVGGEVRIAWGDGGVHQGPLRETPGGIEFYGKRYAKPATVDIAALAGRWEAARGTAIAGGQGINATSLLVIEPTGRYHWASTTGGVVAGRAAASQSSQAGTLQVSGATATLRADNGAVTSYTFVPVAGRPVGAFSLDANMFTRVE